MKTFQARQGDLLIERVERIPCNSKPTTGLVLARGEATGHAHVLDEGVLYVCDVRLYFRAPSSTTIRHEEHGPINLPPGAYRVIRQREYTPQAIRTVRD